MNAFKVNFSIEPLIYHKILTAQTGHALHSFNTELYDAGANERRAADAEQSDGGMKEA